jgi:N-acetylglucosamine malate deacetylase 1
MTNVLVVAPHPDDETLGCGGALLRHIEEGDQVHWLIMSSISHEAGFSTSKIKSRSEEIKQVAAAYKFASFKQANFLATQLDTYSKSELINMVAETVNKVQPEVIYLPYSDDVHSDHVEVFNAVASCVKSFRYPSVKNVRAYETLSETEFSMQSSFKGGGFSPNLWIDITGYLDRKIEIMNIYEGETGTHPFPRSEQNMRALATFRGATAGVNAAESFISLKEIL